jgi:hypothetical protein
MWVVRRIISDRCCTAEIDLKFSGTILGGPSRLQIPDGAMDTVHTHVKAVLLPGTAQIHMRTFHSARIYILVTR